MPNDADFNQDGYVNLYDYSVLANNWLLEVGEAGYNSDCDLQADDIIDSADIGIFVSEWLSGVF